MIVHRGSKTGGFTKVKMSLVSWHRVVGQLAQLHRVVDVFSCLGYIFLEEKIGTVERKENAM